METIVVRMLNQSKSCGISQKDLAARIGVRPQAITEWKTGTTSSYTKYLPQIAEVLGVSIDYLMTGEKEEPTVIQDDELTQKERDLIERFRKLPPDRQQYVLGVTQAAADMQ